ncbi:GtrA family protein [Luteibacter sp. RCC_6_2]|uniref:GtrA family protein n=1 Tax=Luteibacter sp. RCC_6_2 TaxID=3239223 RepID=UPI0035258C56
MKHARLIATYTLFCLISMGVNIAAQMASVAIYAGPMSLAAAMVMGTGAGLCTKYLLDRTWVFAYSNKDAAHEVRTIALYTAMGIVTTVVFWLTEWLFDHYLGEAYRYVGAILGLTIGYSTKYFLDKHFVFTQKKAASLH